MADSKRPTRISMPATAKRGDIIDIKTLIQHDMETGWRRDADGRIVPRDIIARLSVTYDGAEIFSADIFPGVAANPYMAFSTIATQTGPLVFTWTDLTGATTTETRTLTVG
jgi:sulfur-oxidizing protein SoxZ